MLARKRRKARTTNSNHSFPIAPNLLERDFTADAPNEKWMADLTFIETREGWLYLAGILDAYSRKIVGWSMSEHHDAELVKAAQRTGTASTKARSWSHSSFGSRK